MVGWNDKEVEKNMQGAWYLHKPAVVVLKTKPGLAAGQQC